MFPKNQDNITSSNNHCKIDVGSDNLKEMIVLIKYRKLGCLRLDYISEIIGMTDDKCLLFKHRYVRYARFVNRAEYSPWMLHSCENLELMVLRYQLLDDKLPLSLFTETKSCLFDVSNVF